MSCSRVLRSVLPIAVVSALVATLLVAPPAGASTGADLVASGGAPDAGAMAVDVVAYRSPTTGVLVDGFRPPTSSWGPGNRGHEYSTAENWPVTASAVGVVLFAGPVGGALHVTVGHPDGLRTSYSFLAEIRVTAGEKVVVGATVGSSSGSFHFGVRTPDGSYMDPARLLGSALRLIPSLVAHEDSLVGAAARAQRRLYERSAMADLVDWAAATGRWVGDRLVDGAHVGAVLAYEAASRAAWTYVRAVVEADDWIIVGLRVASAVLGVADCTPDSVRPLLPTGRRTAVTVGGLDSGSADGAFDELDLRGLGYAVEDVLRFSYDGGRSPDPGLEMVDWLGSIPITVHSAESTRRSVADSATLLAELLRMVGRLRPGSVIEVYGHSLGGLVAVTAAAQVAGPADAPDLRILTFSSPHGGLPMAGLLDEFDDIPGMGALSRLVGLPGGTPVLADLAEGLGVEVPVGVPVLSLAAQADLIVPATRSRLQGATTVVVSTGGFHQAGLVGTSEARREIELFRADHPPACRPLLARVADVMVPELIDEAHEVIAANLSPGKVFDKAEKLLGES